MINKILQHDVLFTNVVPLVRRVTISRYYPSITSTPYFVMKTLINTDYG